MKTKKLCALAIPLALAACSGRSGAERAVREALKDPDSAKFGEFYYNKDTRQGCIAVNAKNSMGGYTGAKQVRLLKDKDGWHWESEAEETPEDCRAGYASLPSDEVRAEKAEQAHAGEKAEQAHAGETAEQKADRLEREADRLDAAADGSDEMIENTVAQ